MQGRELVDRPVAPEPVPSDPEVLIREASDPEVLIREARRRTRRRRMTCSAVLGVVVLGVLAGVIATRGGARRLSPVTPSSPTTVDARAFQGHGVLAFVSKGSLYLLNGATGRLVHLADPGYAPSDPTLSHDGRWLAYQQEAGGPGPGGAESSHGGDANYQLWIARSNGTDAHRVTSLVNSEIVGWSPSRDVLAVIGLPPQDWTCRSKALTTSVALVTPAGASRTVYKLGNSCRNPRGFYGAVWSPDGKSLAVSTTHFKMSGGSQVVAIDLATGAQRTWFSIRNSQGLPGVCNKGCVPDEIIPDLAGWWPNRGIGFWAFSNGMTHNNDGSPLDVVRAPGAKPEKLGETLSNGTDIAVAASRSGELAIARAAWRDVGMGGTEVQVCAPGVAPCAAVPGASVWKQPASFRCHAHHPYNYCYPPLKAGSPGSGVSLDPAWSPNGSLLAYVRGPAVPQDSSPTAQWLDYHHLFLYSPTTRTAREVAGTDGASAPQWSADGKSVLYVSHDSLWLLNVRSDRSARIAGPLFGGASFAGVYNDNSFYHQVPFTAQFSWSS